MSKKRLCTIKDRYYVQSSQVRGEPRFYWVVDSKQQNEDLPDWTTDKRKAERQCRKLNEKGTT